MRLEVVAFSYNVTIQGFNRVASLAINSKILGSDVHLPAQMLRKMQRRCHVLRKSQFLLSSYHYSARFLSVHSAFHIRQETVPLHAMQSAHSTWNS
jgi:hypothetical protein